MSLITISLTITAIHSIH